MKIKFRVWDKRNNRIIMPRKFATIIPVLDFNGNLGVMDTYKNWHWHGIVPEYEYELMQYTGYKDRNEREVYEGDIYAMEEYRHGEKTVTYWTVIWDETEYGFSLVANIEKSYRGEKYREDVYLPLRFIDGNKMEYTGNIYENPELMEG